MTGPTSPAPARGDDVPAERPTPPTTAPGAGRPRTRAAWAAVAGVVGAATGFAVAEVVALVVAPGASPVLAAGGAVVDQVPPWLKDFAVSTFGTNDKAVLIATMVVVLALGAALSGWLELRRPPWGVLLLVAVGTVGAAVAVSRPDATLAWALPTALGVLVAVLVLRMLVARLGTWDDSANEAQEVETPLTAARERAAMDRRSFLAATGLAAVSAVVVGFGARALAAGTQAVTAVRDALRLPAAATPATAVPAGAELGIDGLAPYVTPNGDYYRIDTALRVPQVDPGDWSLKVTGLVDEPFEITFDELLALPLEEHHVTLACVSNYVGGDLIGNALWLGYPVRELLARARPQAGADMVLSTSTDGWTASTPLDVLQDEGRASLLAVGMNGEPLPVEHGFPARLVVPGLYGFVSATKWVTELKVTTFDADVAYWSTRGWSTHGPIKLASRVDTPRGGATLDAGTVAVAGMAWDQHVGVSKVEVQVDDGAWAEAEIADTVSADTWRQWVYRWDATSGDHTVRVRATNADGEVQTAQRADVAPDGATGLHEVDVTVR